MGKKFCIVFGKSPEDQQLMKSSIAALNDPIIGAQFEHSVEYDDKDEVTVVRWWRKPVGGFDAK